MIKYLIKKIDRSDSNAYLALITKGTAVLRHLFSLLVMVFFSWRKLKSQTAGTVRNR